VAAGQLGVHPDDVRFVDGFVTGIGFADRQIVWTTGSVTCGSARSSTRSGSGRPRAARWPW
jgi:hypothetical protein